jgi:hypothetical protein
LAHCDCYGKSQMEFIAITQAVRKDTWCWENQDVGGIQIRCHLLLCWFHAKKAWIEHLLHKLPEAIQDNLYKAMCLILDSVTKVEFDAIYCRMKATHASNNGVLMYVQKDGLKTIGNRRKCGHNGAEYFDMGM